MQEWNDDLAKVMETSEKIKALKGEAQECRQVKETVRDSLAEYAGWVKKPRVRYFLEDRQLPGRPFKMNARKKGLMILGMLKGHGA